MVKGVFKKILICILVFIMMFNFCIASITFAAPDDEPEPDSGEITVEEMEEKH